MKAETKKAAKARQISERISAHAAAKEKYYSDINNTPIGVAVAPIKADAIARAGTDAAEYIERLTAHLEKHNWNINAVAPYPAGHNMNRLQYQSAARKHSLYCSFTVKRPNQQTFHWNDPKATEFRDVCPESVAVFIQRAKEAAADHYQSFVCKLVAKVGAHTAATLDGNHVWGHSILAVTMPDGSIQKWKTQQIVNCSVYGLLFNQWPSRKVK